MDGRFQFLASLLVERGKVEQAAVEADEGFVLFPVGGGNLLIALKIKAEGGEQRFHTLGILGFKITFEQLNPGIQSVIDVIEVIEDAVFNAV